MRYILLLSTLAIGTCLGADKVLATETTTTIELGDANPVAVGSAKGIMLIGDDAVIDCIKSDSTCSNSGNHYQTSNGLQAYAWANHNVHALATQCSSIGADSSIKTVIIYAGDIGTPTIDDYTSLISVVQSKFPNAKITMHLCDNNDANAVISTLQGVDVINLRSDVYVKEDGTAAEPEDPSAWRSKIIAHYTGAADTVTTVTSNGTINVSLDATTTSRDSGAVTMDTESGTVNTSGTGTAEGKAEGTTSSTATATTSNAGAFNPMVTVIHSLNAKFAGEDAEVYYVPTLDELPLDMQAFVESGAFDSTNMYHGFAAAYTGLYDIEAKTQQYSNDTVFYNTTPSVYKGTSAVRALEVMGYDLMLSDEECNVWVDNGKAKAQYVTEKLEPDAVSLDTVVMDIYKALGQSCYQYNYAFLPDSTLNPETSPLQKDISQMLGDGGTRWDTSEGACYVFTTRTNPDLYWHKAETDRIFTTVQDKYGTYELVSQKDVPTLAEYCQLLAGMMQTYGEPVMTEEEETLLLQVYGANLPTYISDESQLDAIKYLIAKGIFNFTEKTDYAWASPLTRDDLWNTLMAVYDKDSRATFKDVQITTDASLVEAGYYPVSVDHDSTIVTAMSYIPVTNAESTYDYLVETKYIGDKADPALGCTVNGAQSLDNQTQPTYLEGVSENISYSGLVSAGNRRFYHFKVSKRVQGKFDIVVNKTSAVGIDDNVGGVMLDTSYVEGSKNNDSYGNPALLQFDDDTMAIKFDDSVAQYWADKTREREASQVGDDGTTSANAVNAFVYLADDESIPVLIEINSSSFDKLANCKINGTPLDASALATAGGTQTCGDATITRLADGTTNHTITFEVDGFTTYAEFREHVKLTGLSSTVYSGYRRNADSLLVPLSYLESVGIVQEAIQNSSHIQLRTKNSTIYIDNKKKFILNGTGLYQAQKGATLYYKDKTSGEIYVDYRAALGWGTQYLAISDVQTGIVSLTYKSASTDRVQAHEVFGQTDAITSSSSELVDSTNINGGAYMLVNSLYPTANYFVYYSNEDTDGVARDTLVVIKPKWPYWNGSESVDNSYDDTAIRAYVKTYTGVDIKSDNVLVYAYHLSRTDEENGSNPPGIIYSSEFGYLYRPVEWGSSTLQDYLTPALNSEDPSEPLTSDYQSNVIALPFVSKGARKWNCINYNTFSWNGHALPYGYMPEKYSDGGDSSSTGIVKVVDGAWESTTDVPNITIDNISMQNAPTGIQWCLTDMVTPVKFKQVWNDDATSFYCGALRMQKNTTNGNHLECSALNVVVNDSDTFTLLRQTIGGRQVAYNAEKVMTYDPQSVIDLPSLEIAEGMELNQFDWFKYDLQQKLDSTDNFLTKVTYFVISVIPHIVVYICILLIALALVTNVKPWVLFCDKFVDIYSVLTFGRHNVHTIDMRGMFFSSMVGIGIFWLFLDGTVFRLFGWVARAVVGIAIR